MVNIALKKNNIPTRTGSYLCLMVGPFLVQTIVVYERNNQLFYVDNAYNRVNVPQDVNTNTLWSDQLVFNKE